MQGPLRASLVLLCALVLAVGSAGSGEKKDKPKVLMPKEGAVVSLSEELEGQFTAKEGWPVIFVRPNLDGEPFWIQPAVTEVAQGGRFTGQAHFGTDDTPPGTAFTIVIGVAKNKDEAAKFEVGTTLNKLPADLPVSAAITVYRDKKPAEKPAKAPRTVKFSGRTWEVKAGRRLGPGPNDWSDSKDNVWLDERGYLHLAVTKAKENWQCAQIVADRSLGFGEYRWIVSGDLPELDRQVVLGLFTYESDVREIDFELSRWAAKDPTTPNAQWVVQPYTIKENMIRFDTGKAKVLTVSIVWEKAAVHCRCWQGEDTAKPPLSEWTYTGRNVPPPGKERAMINLWLHQGKAPSSGQRQEVVIRSFAFTSSEDLKGR